MATVLHLPPFQLHVTARQLRRDGTVLPLGARAFDLLLALVEARGDLVTKDALLQRAWPGLVVEESNIHVQVSALRRVLGAEAIATVAGLGYRFALPVLDEPAATAADARVLRHTLPAERTAFVGRTAALADARERLARTRLLTLIGIGGTGKTRLARKLAEQALPSFADGVAWVDLAPVDGADTLPAAVAQAVGVRLEGARSPDDALVAALRTRHLLLVLDNCEHLTDAVARLVDRLIGGVARLTVLATSREALALPGEALLPVRPMELPPEDVDTDVEAVTGSEAVRLFVQAALVAHGGFVLDAVTAPAVARICRALDGIPLALELAAAQLQVIGPAQLLDALQERLRLLVGPRRALPRQQTLEAVIRWSHDRLPTAEQRLLAALSVCQGGCDLDAARALAGPDAACADVVSALSRLAEAGLIEVQHVDGVARYRLLETVRQFASARLMDDAAALVRAQHRHAHHHAHRAIELDQALASAGLGAVDRTGAAAIAACDQDRDNLVRALEHLMASGQPEDANLACRMTAALRHYWPARGLMATGLRLSAQALDMPSAGQELRTRSALLQAATMLHIWADHPEAALALTTESVALSAAAGDRHGECVAQVQAGAMLRRLGDFDAAEGALRRALALADAQDDDNLRCAARTGLAAVTHARGEPSVAVGMLTEVIGVRRRLGNPYNLAASLLTGFVAAIAAGDARTTQTWLRDVVDLLPRLGSRFYAQYVIDGAAGLSALRGDWADAMRLYVSSARQRAEIGLEPFELVVRQRERDLDAAATQLGTEHAARCRAEGASIDHEATLARAIAIIGAPA